MVTFIDHHSASASWHERGQRSLVFGYHVLLFANRR
jgi:hypothetical protein